MKTFYLFFLIFIISLNSFAQPGSFKLKPVNTKSALLKSDKISFLNNSETEKKKKRDFTMSLNLYLWALSLDGTSAVPVDNPNLPLTQTPVVDVSLKFSDAIKNLRYAFMLAGNFMYKNTGLLFDVVYVKLKYDGSVPVQSGYVSGTITSNQFSGDFALGYRFPLKNKKVFITGYAGTRIFSMNNKIELFYANQTIFETEKSKTWADLIAGAGARIDISKHWMTYLKGDVGGFGISSKFTGSFLWTLGYKFSEQWNTNLGFKYVYTDYDKDNFLWKASQYGILLSFGYMFL